MAIDADLAAGLIQEKTEKSRRKDRRLKYIFRCYGSVNKFATGCAIALA